MNINIASENGHSQGSGYFMFSGMKIEKLSGSSMRDLTISFQSGDYVNFRYVSYQELELFGQMLIQHAKRGSGMFLEIDLEGIEHKKAYQRFDKSDPIW